MQQHAWAGVALHRDCSFFAFSPNMLISWASEYLPLFTLCCPEYLWYRQKGLVSPTSPVFCACLSLKEPQSVPWAEWGSYPCAGHAGAPACFGHPAC